MKNTSKIFYSALSISRDTILFFAELLYQAIVYIFTLKKKKKEPDEDEQPKGI